MTADIEGEYRASLHGPQSDIRGHLKTLHQAAASRPRVAVIELGVRSGQSTRALLAGAIRAGGQVWSCDIARPRVPQVLWSCEQWHFLQADDLGSDALGYLPRQCDVLFLDAHSDTWTPVRIRWHLMAELRAYAPRVRPGGVILAHDTQWQPPDTDLGEPAGGVARALDDWCAEAGLSWENHPGYYGLGEIRIPARSQ